MSRIFTSSPKRSLSLAAAALAVMLLATFAAIAPVSGADCTLTHHLRFGDSLSVLAHFYKTTVKDILALNPQITNANMIFYGTDICLSETAQPEPFTKTYVVQFGDTLGFIARQFGSDISELVRANGIGDPNMIFAGESITVPAAEATAESTAEPIVEVTPAVEATPSVETTPESAG